MFFNNNNSLKGRYIKMIKKLPITIIVATLTLTGCASTKSIGSGAYTGMKKVGSFAYDVVTPEQPMDANIHMDDRCYLSVVDGYYYIKSRGFSIFSGDDTCVKWQVRMRESQRGISDERPDQVALSFARLVQTNNSRISQNECAMYEIKHGEVLEGCSNTMKGE